MILQAAATKPESKSLTAMDGRESDHQLSALFQLPLLSARAEVVQFKNASSTVLPLTSLSLEQSALHWAGFLREQRAAEMSGERWEVGKGVCSASALCTSPSGARWFAGTGAGAEWLDM